MKGAIRQCGLPGYELGDYIKESIDFLRRHEPPEGYFVGFSGGKDSITTLELCRMAGVKHQAFYSCTRIDPPEMYKFIKVNYPQVTWLFPKKSFWALIQKKMPPFRMTRWCCDELKKKPSKDIPLRVRVMGIRAEESVMRAKRPRIDNYNSKQCLIKPIFMWPEWAVWDFIDAYKVPYPSLYEVVNTLFSDEWDAQEKMKILPELAVSFVHLFLVQAQLKKRIANGVCNDGQEFGRLLNMP